ncbi:Intradiol ring-cleavage dioxygenase [Aspergillus similis]
MHLPTILSALALGASVVAHPGGHHISRSELSRRATMGLQCRDKVSQFHERRFKRNFDRRWHGHNTTWSIHTEAPYFETIQNDTCVLTPEVTQGPYVYPPLADPPSGYDGGPGRCSPLARHWRSRHGHLRAAGKCLLDMWHCNATGSYSSFTKLSPNTPFLELLEELGIPEEDYEIGVTDLHTDDTTFLRGMWPTDKNGVMEMKTIFPGTPS